MGDRTLRVLHVIPGLGRGGGAERSLADVAPGLAAAGIELHVAVLTERDTLADEVAASGAVVHDLSDGGRGTFARARSIRSLIRKVQPDVVHATLHDASLPTHLALLGLRPPWRAPAMLVTWANTTYNDEHRAESTAPGYKLRLVQGLEAVLGRVSATRYHAVTAGVARENRAAIGARGDRVFVGERGRDPERFAPDDTARAATRASLEAAGIPGDARLVVAIGRQEPQKGYDLLLEHFDRIAGGRPDLWLLIAGRAGSATTELERRRSAMTHGDRVRFMGQRSDVAELMALAAVVTCSSWREGAAGSLIEAMATRTPIASVRLAGLNGVLVDGQNALVVERDGLGDAMARILDDPELAARLAEGGRATFEQRFTVERSAARLNEIYRQVAAGVPST